MLATPIGLSHETVTGEDRVTNGKHMPNAGNAIRGGMNVTGRVGDFLITNSGQRFCDDCLTRALPLRNGAQAKRATKALATDPGYRHEVAECGKCGNTKPTIRALWGGL